MTPAIKTVKNAKIHYVIHEYTHEPSQESYGLEASNKLGVSEERVFKTLVLNTEAKDFIVGIAPVSSMLNIKFIAKVAGAKKARMSLAVDVERITGYVLGGVSPLGQKKKLKTVIDSSALEYPTIFVSAGRRGLEIELEPKDLLSLTNAKFAKISQ